MLTGISEVKDVFVIPGLNLNAEVAAMITDLQNGNDAGIQATIDRTKYPFFIIAAASLSVTSLQATVTITNALEFIYQHVHELANVVDELAIMLDLASIYLQYMPDRQAIRYQMDKLQLLLKSTPQNYCANLNEFMTSYVASGKDFPLNNIYLEANLIISQVSDVTGYFRRLVADFGDDVTLHINAGVAAYYVYSYYAGLSTDGILDKWNARLLEVQKYVSDAEDLCMSKSTLDDLSNYMYNIRDTGACPYGNHEERCKSTNIAMTDKFDWMAWSYTCYDSPHGPHAYDEDEISGPQYARSGWGEIQLRGVYMTKFQRDITDDNLVWNCMSGRKNLNCDDVHGILRGCGAGGSLACAEVQLNVVNYRDGDRGFHGYIGGNDVDVWVTWIDTEPITKAQGAANVPKLAAHKITEGAKNPNIRLPVSFAECP